ncbi:MAG TPA: four-helix bundle copper-binding protein [Vicinamibacterales bacterium]|nr:four-helix bundle copper-binding protein [Vicinamibacterales bacterium]
MAQRGREHVSPDAPQQKRDRFRHPISSCGIAVAKHAGMRTEQIIATHPDVRGKVNRALIAAIDELHACTQACTSCADACIAEEMVAHLRQCIRLNLDCADVCAATASVATRRTGSNEELIRSMLATCVTACRRCGEECRTHAKMHEHCRQCAEACERCEKTCDAALT